MFHPRVTEGLQPIASAERNEHAPRPWIRYAVAYLDFRFSTFRSVQVLPDTFRGGACGLTLTWCRRTGEQRLDLAQLLAQLLLVRHVRRCQVRFVRGLLKAMPSCPTSHHIYMQGMERDCGQFRRTGTLLARAKVLHIEKAVAVRVGSS